MYCLNFSEMQKERIICQRNKKMPLSKRQLQQGQREIDLITIIIIAHFWIKGVVCDEKN